MRLLFSFKKNILFNLIKLLYQKKQEFLSYSQFEVENY